MNNIFDPDEIPQWLSTLWPRENLSSDIIAGINEDDCAIIKIRDEQLVITTDFLNASPIAKELGICSFWDLGRLVVAANLSDLCGTGAKPVAMMLAVTMERSSGLDDFKNLIEGVKYELDKYSIPLIGGDTKLGRATALLGIAIGISKPDMKLFKKNEAQAGDLLWVSGAIGSTSAAVDGLTNIPMSEKWRSWAGRKLIEPNLPLGKSLKLSELKIGNGGTDISDGLGADILDLCRASNVGVVIDVENIPFEIEVEDISKVRGIPPWVYAFIIGGDFQFVATTKEQFSTVMETLGFINIGYITSEHDYLLKIKGDTKIKMPTYGHRDSRKKSFSQEVEYLINKVKSTLF